MCFDYSKIVFIMLIVIMIIIFIAENLFPHLLIHCVQVACITLHAEPLFHKYTSAIRSMMATSIRGGCVADQDPVLWQGCRLAQAQSQSLGNQSRFWWRGTLQSSTVLRENGGASKKTSGVHDSSYRSTLCAHFMDSGSCSRTKCDFGNEYIFTAVMSCAKGAL
jgi:hypothetical protein